MSKSIEKFEDVKSFDDAKKMLVNERVHDLESLFSLWRRAHMWEVEEWKRNNEDKAHMWNKERGRKIPETIPYVFKGIKDTSAMEGAMKYSFCGDGYIGRRDLEDDFENNEHSNIYDNKEGERKKFTRFLILKEENNFQTTKEKWEETVKPYNTYYGDWAYDNREVLKIIRPKDGKEVTTTATAAKVAEIARYICKEAKDKFNWGSPKEDKSRKEAIRKFAVLNLNKRGGCARADEMALSQYAITYESFILKEIEFLADEKEETLEFIVFGKITDASDSEKGYFNTLRKILRNAFPSCKIHNLPHPARVSYKDVETRWKDLY